MALNWIKKSKQNTGLNQNDSVTISDTVCGTTFIFRNNCFSEITQTEYIMLATKNNRLYFKEATSMSGWKLTQKANKSTRYMQIRKKFKRFVGNYELSWDKKEGCYYIETM